MYKRQGPYFFIPLRLITTFNLPESLGFVLGCAMGSICGLRRSQASAWPEVATFLIKRKWPKIDRGGPRAPSGVKGSAGGLRLGPPLVSWTVPSLRSPPGKAVGSSANRRASRGARQPGPPLDSWTVPGCLLGPISHTLPRGAGSVSYTHLFDLPESLGCFFRLCHGKCIGLRICQTDVRRPCRHFLDQKKVAKD